MAAVIGVVFDADHHRSVGRVSDECAAAAAGFEYPAAARSRPGQGLPDDCDDGGVGVVGVEDRGFGLAVLLSVSSSRSRSRSPAKVSLRGSNTSGTAPQPDHAASTRCSAAVAGRPASRSASAVRWRRCWPARGLWRRRAPGFGCWQGSRRRCGRPRRAPAGGLGPRRPPWWGRCRGASVGCSAAQVRTVGRSGPTGGGGSGGAAGVDAARIGRLGRARRTATPAGLPFGQAVVAQVAVHQLCQFLGQRVLGVGRAAAGGPPRGPPAGSRP